MKYALIFALYAMIPFNGFSQDHNNTEPMVTMLYFIRHAEKDMSNPSETNMHLSSEGKARAEVWSAVFKNVPLDAVYTTDYHRTKETAMPTAANHQLELTLYRPAVSKDPTAFLETLKGKTVLIVGHSNTIPPLVNAILGEMRYEHLDEDDHRALFIVTMVGDTVVGQVLSIF